MFSNKPLIFNKKTLINCGGYLLDTSVPLVMGIMNVTPDSFYAGSRVKSERAVAERAAQILREGGSIIDIGAHSSRPQAKNISEDEEINRLLPVLSILRAEFPEAVLSVDTFRSAVVEKLYDRFGAFIVNDISAGELDSHMVPLVGRLGLPYIAMHMQGNPQNMQHNPQYLDVVLDEIDYFTKKIQELRQAGIHDILLDPGFGFGKTLAHNYQLLNHLDDFKILGLPILVGLSRKSMLYQYLNIEPDQALSATTVAHTIALRQGANVLRTHDVLEAKQAIEIIKLLNQMT